jgi:DNA helicase-2/ATP-dependent DNA helicase PcrA
VVFLVGLEEGVFPHLRSIGEPDQLEEERRLAYVGITRAMERLYLSHAWSRQLFGSTQYNPVSRFVKEIPDELLDDQGSPRRSGRLSMSDTDGRVFGSAGVDRTAAITAQLNANKAEIAEAASRVRGETTTGAEAMGLRVGDDVRHGRFGDGVILQIKGAADKAEALVRFADAGEKWLLLSWAPLEKV